MPNDGQIDWGRIAADFPINRSFIWLNNCGVTPPPTPVVEATASHLRAFSERAIFGEHTEAGVLASVGERLGRLLGAAPEEIALIHHTTEGMTFVSHGLDLRDGDQILLLENEYPSNVYPWEHWQARGVRIDFVPVGASAAELLANLQAAIGPKTRVVSVSAVHWCTGLPAPLLEIGALCAARGITYVVDGSQGVGLVPIDVHAMKIDFMAFSAWKWLVGPFGLAGFYVRREKLDRLRFPFKGTGSVLDDEVYLPYRNALKPSAARFIASTPNFNDWIYFDASLAYLDRIGFENVMGRIHSLAGHLAQGLQRLGFTLGCAAEATRPTGIVAAAPPGGDARVIVARLKEDGIIAAERLGRVRLAPHVYLSTAQLDRVLARLATLV